jgi:hypothetical protein
LTLVQKTYATIPALIGIPSDAIGSFVLFRCRNYRGNDANRFQLVSGTVKLMRLCGCCIKTKGVFAVGNAEFPGTGTFDFGYALIRNRPFAVVVFMKVSGFNLS